MVIKALRNNVSTRTSQCVRLLEEAGAIIIGLTSIPSAIGYNAGDSSGGAAAVTDGMCTLALGSDMDGSIRIPASCCGCVGCVPAFGGILFAIEGIGLSHTPFPSRGPLARTVADAAIMTQVLAIHEPMQPFSLPADGTDYLAAMKQPIKGRKRAYPPHLGD